MITPLKAARTQRGMTLHDVCERVGISKGYLSDLEHGRKHPGLAIATRIATVYGVALSELWPTIGSVDPVNAPVDQPGLGPLAILTKQQRIDLAMVLVTGTGYIVTMREGEYVDQAATIAANGGGDE